METVLVQVEVDQSMSCVIVDFIAFVLQVQILLILTLRVQYRLQVKLKLLMSVQQDLESKKNSSLCPQCAIFYGSKAFDGLCSSCFKKNSSSKKEELIEKSPTQTTTPASVAEKELIQGMQQLSLECSKKQQKDKKRCFDCNKKVGLLGIECKCGFVYCNGHRLPQNHNCDFDHKQNGKQKLKKQVLKVYNGKLSDI